MLFEVVKAPDGASPQWVRDAWIGVQFQAQQGAPVSIQTRSAGTEAGGGSRLSPMRSSQSSVSERRGYPANARDLLGLLALKNADAARWYLDYAPQMLDPRQVFVLDENCCHAIADLSTPD